MEETSSISVDKVDKLLTAEHKNYIHKQITKTLKNIDWESYIADYLDNMFEQACTNQDTLDNFSTLLLNVIAGMLIKKGLLKATDVTDTNSIEDEDNDETVEE